MKSEVEIVLMFQLSRKQDSGNRKMKINESEKESFCLGLRNRNEGIAEIEVKRKQ